jgi:hypothetical protein
MLCPLPGCEIEQVERFAPDHLAIVAHHRRESARCPDCGAFSTSIHSRYDRHPADLPSFGQALIEPLMPCARQRECPRAWPTLEIVNAIGFSHGSAATGGSGRTRRRR